MTQTVRVRPHTRRPALPLLTTVLGLLALAGCTWATPPVHASWRTHAVHARTSTSVSKVLVLVVENHSLRQMRADMPFTFGLAKRYGYADHYRAVRHPSLPNYLAMTGGSTYGVTDDRDPSVNGTHTVSVFGQALAHGRTAKTYAESMPSNCATAASGRYAVKHNPWAYHLDERADCDRYDVPLPALADDVTAGALPNVGLVVPNLCHDAHDCPLATADRWMKRQVRMVKAGPDFTSGDLAIVVTADEDDRHQDNRVLTVVAQKSLDGVVVSDPLTHWSLSRSLSETAGASPLGKARDADGLLEAFGLSRHVLDATDRLPTPAHTSHAPTYGAIPASPECHMARAHGLAWSCAGAATGVRRKEAVAGRSGMQRPPTFR